MTEHERMLAGDHDAAVRWAREVLADPKTVILDSETTGLHDAEFVEVAVIDAQGQALFESRMKGATTIEPGAYRVHGISKQDLAGEPPVYEVIPRLRDVLADRRVVVYNRDFDRSIYAAHLVRLGMMAPGAWSDDLRDRWECAMEMYAQFFGEWSGYHHSYRYQKLRRGDHTALGDARAALALIREMASADFAMEPRDRLKEIIDRVAAEAKRRVRDPKNVDKGDHWRELEWHTLQEDHLDPELREFETECAGAPHLRHGDRIHEAADILTVLAMLTDKADAEDEAE